MGLHVLVLIRSKEVESIYQPNVPPQPSEHLKNEDYKGNSAEDALELAGHHREQRLEGAHEKIATGRCACVRIVRRARVGWVKKRGSEFGRDEPKMI